MCRASLDVVSNWFDTMGLITLAQVSF